MILQIKTLRVTGFWHRNTANVNWVVLAFAPNAETNAPNVQTTLNALMLGTFRANRLIMICSDLTRILRALELHALFPLNGTIKIKDYTRFKGVPLGKLDFVDCMGITDLKPLKGCAPCRVEV